MFGGTGGDGGVVNDLRGVRRAFLGGGVEGEDDRVARFQGNQRFEDGSRGRVGGGGDAADDADRFGNQGQTGHFVFADDANGFGVAHLVENVLTGKEVFRCLVFKDAALRFIQRVFGEDAVLIQRGH